MRQLVCSLMASLLLAVLTGNAGALTLDARTLRSLNATPIGASVDMPDLPISIDGKAKVRMKRIDVYATDARIISIDASGEHEIARSDWLHFIADKSVAGSPRIGLSMAPDGSAVQGVVYAADGTTWKITAAEADGKQAAGLTLALAKQGAESEGADFACFNAVQPNGMAPPPSWIEAFGLDDDARKQIQSVTGGSRQAVIAIDTDNELLQLKFSNNTTNATNYLAALFTAMNVIYERDLDLALAQGNTTLRPSSSADPYASTSSTSIITQLDEFGGYWRDNNAAVPRVLAAMISGKAGNNNSSAGIAWLVSSGNYCSAKGTGGSSNIFGHYSINRVFKFAGANAADDVQVVAHELGHNFGVNHTHCTNTAGGQPASTSTLDACYNGESGLGCYAGTESCPAGGNGTLMSYCHLSSASCGVSEEFHPVQETVLLARIASNVGFGCITSTALPNLAPNITRPASIAVTEDTAANLSGISFTDADAGTGVLNVTVSVPSGSGTIAATASGGVSIVSGSGSNSLQLSGTLANLNAWFASNASNPDYTPPLNANVGSIGNVILTITVSDNGNSGSGGALSDTDTSTLMIAAVNDAPLNALPGGFVVTEDTTTSLAGMSVSDVDIAAANMSLALSVPSGQGVFSAANAGGVVVSGNASNALVLTATLSNLNSYLGNVAMRPSYVPVANSTTAVTLTITSNDGGATGSGGSLSDVDTRTLSITAVNDGPNLSAPTTQPVASTGTTPIAGIVLSDIDSGNGNLDVVISVSQGQLSSSNLDGVTVVGGNNTGTLSLLGDIVAFGNFFANQRVNFNPNGNAGNTTLTINCDDNGNTGAGTSIACTPQQIALTPIVLPQILFANGFE